MKLLAGLAGLTVLCAPMLTRAHGAVPVTLDVHFADRGQGREPFVVTTYGMVFRQDGRWVMACEESVSPGPKEWSLSPEGLVVMGHAGGISTSTDFCRYPSSTGVPSSVRWLEQAPLANGDREWWALVDLYEPGRNVWKSAAGSEAYTRVPIPDHLLANAIRADPHVPGRVVLTAQDLSDRTYHLLLTEDAGQTWTTHPLDLGLGIPRVVSVGPSGLFVRITQLDAAQLYRSTDSGQSLEKVLDLDANPGFVTELSNGELWTATGPNKAWRSTDGGTTWTKREDVGTLMCLREDGDTLYACVIDRENNVAVKTSTDGGSTWTPFLRYDEIHSMLACGGDTEGATCEDYWLLSAIGLGIELGSGDGPDEPEADGGCAGAPLGSPLLALLALLGRPRSRR